MYCLFRIDDLHSNVLQYSCNSLSTNILPTPHSYSPTPRSVEFIGINGSDFFVAMRQTVHPDKVRGVPL